MAKLWILNPFTDKVIQVAEDDPRLQKNGEELIFFKFARHRTLAEIHALPFWHCKSPKDAYRTASYWGATEEEFCERYNKPIGDSIANNREQIQNLEARIVELEKRKLVPKQKKRAPAQ